MRVWFGILGPLLIEDDPGDAVRVPSGRLRVLAAALLADANHVVARDELTEIVWDGKPPATADRTLQVHMVRLRRALGPAIASRIRTRGPGYLWQADAGELDLLDFEMLRGLAARAAQDQDWPRAEKLLRQALDLWRDTPFADAPSALLRDRELPRLEQLRLQAAEDRIDAALHLDRPGDLIPELRDLIARHPLREHPHAQLMLALDRSGRRAEALDAYQHARQVLSTDLGVEPGPELRDAQQRILAGHPGRPAATVQPAPPSGAAITGPLRQLPAGSRHFTGRAAEIGMLARLAGQTGDGGHPGDSGHPGDGGQLGDGGQPGDGGGTVVITAIDGMAGIGKTALAVHVAHRLDSQFPDGQLFIDLHGYTSGYQPRGPGQALETLLRNLGIPAGQIPDGTDERAALWRQRLAGTRTLIVLDNAADEGQVRPLLPGGGGCLVLITSRRRLTGLDDALALSLDVLPETDAVSLLRAMLGPDRAPEDDPVLVEIASLCGHLPLALRIAAALLTHRPSWTAGHLAGMLRDQRQRLATLSAGDRDLDAAFTLSYAQLTAAQQSLFRSLGLVPGPDLDAYAAASLTGQEPGGTSRRLQDLVDHNLVIEHAPGRYRLHDLLRLHAAALADRDPAAGRAGALGRLLDYYQYTAGRADAIVSAYSRPAPGGPVPAFAPDLPGQDAAWEWLRTERTGLLAALDQAAGSRQLVALTAGLASLLRADGPWPQAVDLHAAAVVAAQRDDDQAGQAGASFHLGDARSLTGDYPGAIAALQEAAALYRRIGDTGGEANALTRLGHVRCLRGDLPAAIGDLREAVRLHSAMRDQRGQATSLTRLGQARALIGEFPAAIRDQQQALDLYRALGERRGQASTLTILGDVRRLTGDPPAAARDLRQALDLYRELGDRQGQATALTWLANTWRLAGDLPRAAQGLTDALRQFRELDAPLGQGMALTLLGETRRAAGDLPIAISDLQEALDLFRRLGAVGSQGWVLNFYAAAIASAGDNARALGLRRQALRMARLSHQPDDEALALEGIGECHLRAGHTAAGVLRLERALSIFRRLRMQPDVSRVQARLATLPA
jgi:DNA-binding SARP family transcriptional activator